MVESLLNEYDLCHASIINGGKVTININYKFDKNVCISLVTSVDNNERNATFECLDDEEFKTFILPKILQRFLSKNIGLKHRRIMGKNSYGTLVVQRKDSKESLIIRNCPESVMNLVDILFDSLNEISNINVSQDSKIIFKEDTHERHDNYMKYNIVYDFSTYKTQFFKSFEPEDYDHSNIKNSMDDEEINSDREQLLILNIARYAYTFENIEGQNIWEEIKKSYKDNEKVVDICNAFKEVDYAIENIYIKALILAEFEKNNDLFLHQNDDIVEAALQACDNSIDFFNNSYLVYWRDKERYYSSILDGEHQAICLEFIEAHDLSDKKIESIEVKNRIEKTSRNGNKNILSQFKKIKDEKNSFSSIINESVQDNNRVEEEVEKIFLDVDREKILVDAEEQARKIIEIEKERDQLKKDAEEFAKIILKNEKEHKKIVEEAEQQARRIIELEKENEELKKLAQENARYLFDREQQLQKEENLRQEINNMPIKSQDIDKINNLLNAISTVKELDFAINHPIIMQELLLLEEKIITYLTTHKNIVHEEDKIVPIEKEEMIETKPIIELLAMIRNAYVSSHYFEKDGRHTLINFNPVDDDTYRVSLYSILGDSEDVLMDAFFEEYQLTEKVLKELCEIFKSDAVIVASKTDNIPPDKADYIVIDNMNNAIKFADCSKELIDKIKEYL